ncbi:hypothetical protein H4Q26_012910 [Puccinia striiformis f. sp. tritici PST-130]|nr:hypothetical protein H4Q26_012910 [Puccinia striiformis f. sp. tritici PST-130]
MSSPQPSNANTHPATADDNNGEGLGNDDRNRSANTEEPPSTSQPTTPGTRESTDQEELLRAQKIAANAQSDS